MNTFEHILPILLSSGKLTLVGIVLSAWRLRNPAVIEGWLACERWDVRSSPETPRSCSLGGQSPEVSPRELLESVGIRSVMRVYGEIIGITDHFREILKPFVRWVRSVERTVAPSHTVVKSSPNELSDFQVEFGIWVEKVRVDDLEYAIHFRGTYFFVWDDLTDREDSK